MHYGSRVIAASLVGLWLVLSANAAVPQTVDLTVIANVNNTIATSNSYSNRFVSNDNGIFFTYLHETYSPIDAPWTGLWRLMQSTDGGNTFNSIYESAHGSPPPVMETDQNNNLYLSHPDWDDSNNPFYFYKFSAADNYATPVISTLPGVPNGGKFAMTFDEPNGKLYIGTQSGGLLTVDTEGNWLSNEQLLAVHGPNGHTQYPLLKMDQQGNLHHAWTTVTLDGSYYYDIHHMMSPDGGASWQNVGGAAINSTSPIIPDETGPTLRITLDDEFYNHTWLSNMLPKDGKVHFSYQATSPLDRMHYVRYDTTTGSREIDTWTDDPNGQWRGTDIRLEFGSLFFAADRRYPNTPLYAVARDTSGYIACLISDDNGDTWEDYARSDFSYSSAFAIGGASQLTDDGHIVGYFTNVAGLLGNYVMFLDIPTTLVIPHQGDSDNDGDVDIFDYMTITAAYGRAGTSQWRWVEGDFDEDGDIDIFDYMALTAEYGWTEGGGGDIPEPATMALLGLGVVGLLRRR